MKSPWPTKKLGDKEFFEILGSGIDRFDGEKFYLSTSSIEGNKIVKIEDVITYDKRPSRANMQPRLNSVWFARMQNTIKVYSFTEKNKDEIDKYILSTGFAGILCKKDKVNPSYVEKIFLSKWFNDLKDRLAGDKAIQKSLNNEDIEFLEIPLPPLHIQQKIVKILDTIQEAVGVQEKIIELTKELKKSVMADLFKYGAPSFRKGRKLKKTEIGEIPENWEVVRLGEVCFVRKEQILPEESDIYVGLEHLDSGAIKLNRWGKGNEVKSFKNKFYPKDILYGKLRPYLDKAVIVENEGVCSTDLIVIRCEESKIFPFYLINFLHTPQFLNFAISTMSGTNHPRTSWDLLKTFKIPLPPLPEQQEIAEILQTIDQKIEIEKKKKALYEELFKTMLNKLMNGEIDVENLDLN